MHKICEGEWIFTFDPGIRMFGRVKDRKENFFTLDPAFEYVAQGKVQTDGSPDRVEMLVAHDLIGDVALRIRPTAYTYVKDLPEWRQRQLQMMVEKAMAGAAAYGARQRSGILIAVPPSR